MFESLRVFESEVFRWFQHVFEFSGLVRCARMQSTDTLSEQRKQSTYTHPNTIFSQCSFNNIEHVSYIAPYTYIRQVALRHNSNNLNTPRKRDSFKTTSICIQAYTTQRTPSILMLTIDMKNTAPK